LTALTVYLTNFAATTVTTSNTLIENATTGASLTNKNTNLTSGTTGWVEILSQGGTFGAGVGSEPSPSGKGWIDDGTTLEGFHFASGTWTFNLGFECTTTGTFTADVHFRAYQRSSGGTYTLIGEATASGQTIISTSYTVVSASGSFSASATFATGDKLYIDCLMNITTNSTTGNMRMQQSSSATTGSTSADAVTPGYISSTQVDKDVVVRARIQALVDKDVRIRGRLKQLVNKDVALRGNVGLQATKDVVVRARIQQLINKDVGLRGRISALVVKDVGLRGRINILSTKDVRVRGIVAASGIKDVRLRGRINILVDKDIGLRGKPANTVTKDIVIRANVTSPPLASGGFTLWANGTGTASFDHFRVTQFPDPSLSLSTITPRVGTTLVSWNSITPASTTLGVDISLDGVNWTDVTSGNNGSLPGIYSQTDPVVDGFDIVSTANYTNTFRTGGATATWTYNTGSSQLTATSGTNALYLYSAISKSDVDFFVDMDQSDAGGMVWRYVDGSNFYYLLISDSLSSTGVVNAVTLYKVASNVRTQLGTSLITYTVGDSFNGYTASFIRGTYHRFRVTMLGGVITVYADGNVLITYTDGSPLGAGLMGLYNNGGTVGSRYYQLWMQPLGDYVTGTPQFDIVTGDFVYTRCRLATTSVAVSPQVLDLTTMATTPSIGAGAILPNVAYTSTTVAKNIDDLAKKSNYSWFIDPSTRTLVFRSRGATASPWILQSVPYGLASVSDIEIDTNLELDVGNDLYRNRQTILGAFDTANFVDSLIGDGSTRTFPIGYIPASAPTVTLNGYTQTVGLKGSSGFSFYYNLTDPNIVQDSSLAVLQPSDKLVVTYVGQFPVTIVVDDLTKQAAQAAIEGGTGIVENVVDVTGQGVNRSAATSLANQLISRYGTAGRTLIFDTTRNGLAVGQLLSIFLPEHGIFDGQFFITQIEITLMKGRGDTQVWWYKTTASELPRQASWAKLLASGLGLQ